MAKKAVQQDEIMVRLDNETGVVLTGFGQSISLFAAKVVEEPKPEKVVTDAEVAALFAGAFKTPGPVPVVPVVKSSPKNIVPLQDPKRPFAVVFQGQIKFRSKTLKGERVTEILSQLAAQKLPLSLLAVIDERDGTVYSGETL